MDIDAVVSDELLAAIKAVGGTILGSPDDHSIGAVASRLIKLNRWQRVEISASFSRRARPSRMPGGLILRATLHIVLIFHGPTAPVGSGVKVGVISTSIDDGTGAFTRSKASGDVPNNLVVLPGQAGPSDGEGLAMCEIVHDLAPSATLYFATGENTNDPSDNTANAAVMAQNIRALAARGCKVIIDDLNFPQESPFQDGVVAKAVNDVSAAGVLYFSCARNSGSKTRGTSSTWEGDFVDGGDASSLFHQQPGSRFHAFAPGVVTNTDMIDPNEHHRFADLFWSDPLGGSNNDYDLYVFDSTNRTLKQFSLNTQDGTQDPYEHVEPLDDGDHFVIVKYSGAPRFLHLDAGRTNLSVSTGGCVRGHNASGAANAFCVGETSAEHRTVPFIGGTAVHVVTESSDGPRRMFFNANGVPYTPGNFSSTGGIVLQKPDITAASGGVTTFPLHSGFNPFYGTSAAAPHAGAIAAQILSYRPGLTPAQVRTALYNSCLDIEAPGFDRVSGRGIVMALASINFVGVKGDFNFNGGTDIIFQHTSGARSVWLLNGASYVSSINLGTVSTNWNIAGLGDFNRDGYTDILWQSTAGARSIWLMRGATRTSIVNIGTIAPAWSFVSAGDFNGDGIPDIVLQHTSGACGVWIMNGVQFARSVGLPATPASVHIAASGDFNGDGSTDLVLQDTTTGARSIWLMNRTTFVRSVSLGTLPLSWKMVGAGDFNRDGKTDIILENTNGARQVWIMNGTTHFGTYNLPSIGATWSIKNH